MSQRHLTCALWSDQLCCTWFATCFFRSLLLAPSSCGLWCRHLPLPLGNPLAAAAYYCWLLLRFLLLEVFVRTVLPVLSLYLFCRLATLYSLITGVQYFHLLGIRFHTSCSVCNVRLTLTILKLTSMRIRHPSNCVPILPLPDLPR